MRRLSRLIAPLSLACALALTACQSPAAGPATPEAAPAASTAALALEPTVTPAAPTEAPTVAPTAAPTEAPTAAPTEAPTVALPAATLGAEILFLRGGQLVALDPATGAERTLADGVGDFAATPDGRQIAMVRGEGDAAEIWLVGRDGEGLRQLTSNQLAEGALSWSPDGMSLAYTTSLTPEPRAPTWRSWSEWCAEGEARVAPVGGAGPELLLGAGCEPVFSPDGRRIAFTTPPTAQREGSPVPNAVNAVMMVNRQGQNAWNLAEAEAGGMPDGYVVHGAAWATDGGQVAYQRFIGYQALTDINLTEASSSFERAGAPIGFGAGWLLTPAYAPGGDLVAVVEHNFSDARGFSGYDIWTTNVLRLGEQERLDLPSESLTLQATEVASLPRAAAAAWAPDGAALAVLLPAGWRPGLGEHEPVFAEEEPGELWLWRPGSQPERRLAEGVDFASPLLWLPPPPAVAESAARVALAVPAGWSLRESPADYLIADGPGGRAIAARLVAGAPSGGPEALFPELLSDDVELGDPVGLPDGSTLYGARGGGPGGRALAGLLRLSPEGDAAAIYLADAADWPLERARAMALLATSGR